MAVSQSMSLSVNARRTLFATASLPVWVRAPKRGHEFYSGCSRAKLYEWATKNLIRSVSIREPGKIKGVRLFHLASILAFISQCEADAKDGLHDTGGYRRMKTGTVAIMRLDAEMAELLRDLPGSGPLFPYLRTVRAGDRATEFKQRCVGLKIKGVSLHSYRYSWAERAKTVGYPERYAQVNIGQNSKAVHRAYSRNAPVEMPALSEYEKQQKAIIGNHNPEPAATAVAA